MVKRTKFGSFSVGELPLGCQLCTQGAKLVLFVTGVCKRGCYYCPLSPQRKGKDITFANERPVRADEDIIEEAVAMDALGTGMTGGEPLSRLDRTIGYLKLLKTEFGTSHHVHLYTSHSQPGSSLKALRDAGLDEIRFHATLDHLGAVRLAAEAGLRVGVEIPAIPGEVKAMIDVATAADASGSSFLNINELEMCETTAREFRARGLRVVSDESMAVRGSLEAALEVAEYCEQRTALDVHVCPSTLKDRVQLRNRLGRIAQRVRRPYELIDEDNLLVKCVITPRVSASLELLRAVAAELRNQLALPPDLLVLNEGRARIETLPELGERVVKLVHAGDLEVALTEEYPTWDRLETERRPLN